MKYSSIYIILFCSFFVSCDKREGKNDLPPLRTLIVYMSADNDLSEDAWDNIREMQRVYEERGTNLIVFIDPVDDVPHILRIEQGKNTRIKTYSEFNSADASQMGTVLQEIIEMYPAESYGLILWSHGTSWLPAGRMLRSFAEDNGRQIDIVALAGALPVRFDFILMDACLMGSVEVAYELRNKTDFIIASSTEIISTGFPYKLIIPELMATKPDLRKVSENYFNFYDRQTGDFRSATIALINTGELERLASVTNLLIADCVFDTETFDRTSVQRLDVYDEPYTFDFIDFIKKAFPDADINPLKEQLDKTVLYKAHTPEFIGLYDITTYCGLSCYIPGYTDLDDYYQQLNWCQASGFYRLFH